MFIIFVIYALFLFVNENFSASGAGSPTLSIISPENNTLIIEHRPTIKGIALDLESGIQQVEVKVDNTPYYLANGTTSWSYITSILSKGPHTVTVRAIDKERNIAKSSITFTINATIPSSPKNLKAAGSSAQIFLNWQAPKINGGFPITNYKIYRSTTQGTEILITRIGNVLAYNDNGLTNGVTYYYKIAAINSAGESSQSNEASAIPTSDPTRNKAIISFIRPDLDSKSLVNVVHYVQSLSKKTDFVFGGGISGYMPKWKFDENVQGQLMVGGTGNNTNTKSSWRDAKIKHGVDVVFFDEEPTISLTDVEAGSITAHSLGLNFVTTPTYRELATSPLVIRTVSQYSDIVNLQIYPGEKFTGSDSGLTYAQCIQKYEMTAKHANPNVKIFVQYITGPDKTNSGNMNDQIAAFNSVKSYVDGVFIWYYQTPDPTPVLKEFYKGTGLVG